MLFVVGFVLFGANVINAEESIHPEIKLVTQQDLNMQKQYILEDLVTKTEVALDQVRKEIKTETDKNKAAEKLILVERMQAIVNEAKTELIGIKKISETNLKINRSLDGVAAAAKKSDNWVKAKQKQL